MEIFFFFFVTDMYVIVEELRSQNRKSYKEVAYEVAYEPTTRLGERVSIV